MDIIGSGEVSKKDIQKIVQSNYKYNLKLAFQMSLIYLCLIFLIVKYYFDTTYLGAHTVQLIMENGLTAVFAYAYLILLLELFCVFLCFSTVKRSQFDGRKPNIGAQENVLINASGINIFSEKLSGREIYRIGWNSVAEVELKKQYLYIYTTSKSVQNLCIPSRYFSEDDLVRKILQIQGQER
ncbi:hypothetical protein [Granulicatella seriolae]|uniref:YcxB family protein n=1 Tax=Granulicatella seriolae TaxID=2967226 RepID=A0ABT1WSF0_9LACT|nr:hypothetical protein [Granulicatella seriolae]